MIYLDNSATTYPKPKSVVKSFEKSFYSYGANAGRGFYNMAINTTEQIFNVRKKLSVFFDCDNPENVVLCYNCTSALNMAIKGIAKKGGHFIISDLEHNSVLRCVGKLKSDGVCDYSIAQIDFDDDKTIQNFSNCIRKNTIAIICTGASNVFGIITPYKKLAQLAHKNKLLFVLDAAQIGGVVPISVKKDDIDILCCAGHKSLYGPSGTGVMIMRDNLTMNTIIEGGTGSNSVVATQPDILPDKFESGTPNVQGIIGLGYGVNFVNKIGVNNIYNHEKKLVRYLEENLTKINGIKLYNDYFIKCVPILSFNVENMHSEEVAEKLSDFDIAVRAGLHCSPLAHKKLGTIESGTVRISPSVFTQKKDIDFLIKCVRKIAK